MDDGRQRNKEGHPIYSREDIREQYCINSKELGVFEDDYFQEHRLFGCLSTSHLPDKSPCNKSNSLLSCVQKRKSSVDDLQKKPNDFKTTEKQIPAIEDEEDSDGGFKRRIKPRTFVISEYRSAWTHATDARLREQSEALAHPFGYSNVSRCPPQKAPLQVSYSQADANVSSSLVQQPYRPCLLHFDTSERPAFTTTCRSFDELNGKPRPSDWYTPGVKSFETRDFWDEENREKHVSFDSHYIVRSNTIGGGLRSESQPQQMPESTERLEMVFPRRAFSPPIAMSLRGRNHSQERLIKAVVRQAERSISSVRSLDLAALQSTSSVYTSVSQHVHPSSFYTSSSYIPAYRFIRRAIMRTQATQTEAERYLGKHSRLIPAYLTLSPRASSKKGGRQQRYSGHYLNQYHRRFDSLADNSEKAKFIYSDESDDETMVVHLKEHKPRKALRVTAKSAKEKVSENEKSVFKSKTRSRIKAQKSVDESETMVLLKPSVYETLSLQKEPAIYKSSFEKSHSVDELENYQSQITTDETVLVRRHSLAEDFSGEKCFTLLYPPPGFDESLDELRKERNHRIEESPGKSSTDSSKAIYSGLTDGDQVSITEIDELDSSLRSHESPTIVSEIGTSGEAFVIMPSFESDNKRFPRPETNVTRRPLIVGPPQVPSSFKNGKTTVVELTSPESEASSHLTEVLSSKSEKTSSSSEHYEIIEEKQSGTGSGSSIYATATDQSPREYAKDKQDEGQTSFETASSAAASQFSSPSSSGKRKSSSSGAEEQLLSPDHAMETKHAIKQISLLSPVRPQATYPRSPKKQSRYLFPEEPKSESSEDSSTTKRERTGSPGSESMGSKSIELLEEFDSEGIGDGTPLYELCSSDPSTAFEPTTVVENVNRLHKERISEEFGKAVEFYVGGTEPEESDTQTVAEIKQEMQQAEGAEETLTPVTEIAPEIETEGGETDVVESDEFEPFISDEAEFALTGAAVFCRRTLSGELSTVSEVSEEMSNQKSDISSSLSSIEKNKSSEQTAAALVEEETVPKLTEITSRSSSRSTTSGSFVIDCHSEMHSLSEDVKHQRAPVKRTESLPCLATEEECMRIKEEKSGTSESPSISAARQEENTAISTSEKVSPERAKGDAIAGQIDTAGESSQATERDVARSEFSLEQQSSQEIDEESLSMGAYCVTIPAHEHSLLADSEDTSSTTTPTNQQWRWKQPDVRGRALKTLDLVSEHETDTDVEEKQIEKDVPKITSDSQSESSPKTSDVCRLHHTLESGDESTSKGVPCPHKFTCTHCGRTVSETASGANRKVKDTESVSKPCLPHLSRKSATIEEIITEKQDDEQDIGVHAEAYRSAQWFYIGSKDELVVWGHRLSPATSLTAETKHVFTDDITDLERSFRKQYDAITHRMIHRKASIEMYRKILEKSFSIEKTVNVLRNKGEFGFRIHGSRPVVVSAIEKGTPAETCGLEIGDIVVSVNGINVLEASHSDVVRLAHSGSECLKLELVPTCHILEQSKNVDETGSIVSGYLEKKCSNIASDSQEIMWKKRWFVLKTDLYLYSYKKADETELLGAYTLQSCCASIVSVKSSESSTIFKISKYSESPQFFAASDEKTALKWVNSLNEASNRLSQVDPFMETTLRRIHVPADSISNEDACGYLEKLNQRRKVWKQRYFVLKDACLYFYADKSAKTALGIFYLHGYKVQSCTTLAMKNTFEAIPPESRFRHLWLKADNELDKKKWLAALEYSIDRWLKLI